jgi:lipoprotein-anchoring transpeptidase ErfK/SrfK
LSAGSGRGALEGALFEHLPAIRADDPLDLVGNPEALAHHVGQDRSMRVAALAMKGEELRHRHRTQRSDGFGSYDAQKGDEVVTNWRVVAKLIARVLHRLVLGVLSLPALFVLAGCGGTATRTSAAVVLPAPAKHCLGGTTQVGSSRVTVVAIVLKRATAYRRPLRKPFARFGHLNQNDFPTVFRVVSAIRRRDCGATWYRVQLPIKPNGVEGYVRARDVRVASVRTRIVVQVSRRRLTLFRRGRPVLHTTVAVGSAATPTPTGSYYVNQRLIPTDPSGPYGPGAIGISAFSTVLTGWTQGGPIAIHGTNEPWSIGRAVSNGCIRVRNPVLRKLFSATAAGTPVVILR